MLARPQFFPLTLARSKRGEGPSLTLNKGVALLWSTGGLLSLCWVIPKSPPFHCGTRAVTPWRGDCPRFSVGEGPSPRFGSSSPLWLGPGSHDDLRGSIGRDISWKVEFLSHLSEEAGRFFPPPPRRKKRLMRPSESSWLPGLG